MANVQQGQHELLLILDFGGQYKELIARRVRECGVLSIVRAGDISAAAVREMAPIGIILTGGPNSVYCADSPHCDREIFELGIPVLVDYSGIMSEMNGGGGTFGLPELKPDEGVKATYYHAFTADELDAIVRGNGCTVLYIQKLDDIFVQSYSDLFTDKLAAAQAGKTLLYRVTDAGFAPMQMEVSAQ